MEWIRTYLGYRSELNGGSQEDVSDKDVEEFYVKCSKFQLVSSDWIVAFASLTYFHFDNPMYLNHNKNMTGL